MATKTNKEIHYENFPQYVEHITGKTILSWKRCIDRHGQEVYFTDGTMTFFEVGQLVELKNMQFWKIPKSICVSCGEDMHISEWDMFNRCNNTVNKFWEKVRALYWHRYLQTKNT